VKIRQKIIGVYHLGYYAVELVLREGTGGEFYTTPEHGKIPRIKVGADYKDWSSVVTVLLHECFEFAMDTIQVRYKQTDHIEWSSDSFSFFMTHTQFADCCSKVAGFMTPALPDLAKEWNLWQHKEKKLTKKAGKK